MSLRGTLEMIDHFKNIEHIGIFSPNTKKLAEWYCSVFGLEVSLKISKESDEKSVYFLNSANGMFIEILPSNDKERLLRSLNDPGISHIGIVVNNFNKVSDYLNSKEIALRDVRETSQGWKIGYFNDLDGNILEIIHRP